MTSQDQTQPAPAPDPDDLPASPDTAPPVPDLPPLGESVTMAAKPRARSAFAGAVMGGALAVAAGFALAQFDLLGLRPDPDDSALRALEARAEALEHNLAAARAEAKEGLDMVTGKLAATVDAEAGDIPALQGDVAALSDRLGQLETTLAGLSDLPADGSLTPAQLAALSASVETLRTQVAGLQAGLDDTAVRGIVAEELAAWESAAAEKLRAETDAAEAAAARATALSQLAQAAQTGAPYAKLLPALGPDLPEVIVRYADTGLPALAEAFPGPARAALDAARRAAPGAGLGERFLSFLRLQTGARSLTPQEGDDPDAVLSRAEAALAAGEVQQALDELSALPPEAQTELADFTRLAQDHLAFDAALQSLSTAAKP